MSVLFRWTSRERNILSTILQFHRPCLCYCSTGTRSSSSTVKRSLVDELMEGLRAGKRSSLATAITLVETQNSKKKLQAQELLEKILAERPDHLSTTFRIGLSGPPGAGKSTFIEVIGKFLTAQGHKVAVLAVDPSSATTGGSLLGDKTRMPELTRDPNAYIRPSPARGHLGGVTRSTNEAILLCEYGGYDIIIVETVGVGQSEYAVTNMVDIFVLLLPPGGGDELQGIKRGIIERADLLVVTKSDGDLAPAAHRTQYEYMAALKFMRSASPKWKTKVLQVSSKTNEGIEKFWEHVKSFKRSTAEDFFKKRGEQRTVWMWTHLEEELRSLILEDPHLQKIINSLLLQVKEGTVSPGAASDKIIANIRNLVNTSNTANKSEK